MARESFKATPGDRVKLQVIETDDRPMTVDLDGKLDPVMLPADNGSGDDTGPDNTTDPAEWNRKNATDPKGVTPRVQKRFDRLKAETETEKRIRLQVERERDEAVAFNGRQQAEINDLRRRLSTNTDSLAESMKGERESRVTDATRRLEQAHAEGNSGEIAKATADMTRAQAELATIVATAPPKRDPAADQQRQVQQPPRQQTQAPQLSPDVVAWVSANPRFNSDDGFTRTAVGIHSLLEAKGIKPGMPAYIKELDRHMKLDYPDHQPYSGSSQDEEDDEVETIAPRRTNAVAPGSRETGQGREQNSRTMELSPRQVAIARGLGLTTKEQLARYAIEIRKREPNGSSA